MYFEYGEEELSHLSRRDPVMGEAVRRLGKLSLPVKPDLFEGLVFSVICRQNSHKGSNTVWERLVEALGAVTPERVRRADMGTLSKAGVSLQKSAHIKSLAQEVYAGELDLEELRGLSDEEVKERLLGRKGMGPWTVDMFLIFSMQRRDVLCWDDLSLRRGMIALYRMSELTRPRFERLRERYRPFGTIASFYLWEIRKRSVEHRRGQS